MNNNNFAMGILGIVLSLTILTFFTDSGWSNNTARIAGSIGSGIGGLLGILFFGGIAWGVIRLIRGRENAPEVKGFLLRFSSVFCVVYVLAKIAGLLPN